MKGQTGQALLALHRPAEARERLQTAVELLEQASADPSLLDEARFHLARARWELGERAEAWDEASAVRERLAEHGPAVAREDVDAWLRAHPRGDDATELGPTTDAR